MMYGQLTPAGRSMTPTCQGRIKAPPICSAPALQKVASGVSELTDNKVCFSLEEAESCAAKARLLWETCHTNNNVHHHASHLLQQQQHHPHGGGEDVHDNNEVPLNIDGITEYWKIHAESAAAAAEVKAYVSSSSTVVTNTSMASSMSICGGGGREGSGSTTTPTPVMKKDRPPLEVVRTDNEDSLVLHSEDEHNPHPVAATASVNVEAVPAAATSNSSSVLPLSRDFTDKLVKGNSSRQGRSLQRWLVHSQTDELVRQVAGTVPITRDGRIVLVSASRKSEWILPKGGWDADEASHPVAATASVNVEAVPAAATSNSSSVLPLSRDFTDKLVKGNSSRQGRSLQRWLVHSQTDELVRQVAGTVPITRDGRIVLVSASRKSEWILPKGGWDADETREECAARETYEEAGLLGRLGACLDPIDYETGKAKKRRLSMMLGGGEVPPLPKRIKKVGEGGGSSYSPTGPELTEDGTAKSRSKFASKPSSVKGPSKSDPKNYSYVRLLLFPLYISEVKNDWPEKGRLRKLVDINEAIKIMEKEDRGYFKRGLEMIRDRGLCNVSST